MYKISTPRLASAMSAGQAFALVDVHPEPEHARRHIPQAINIPVDTPQFTARVTQRLPHKGTPVVVYSAGTDCDASARAAEALESAGFAAVYDYDGGIDAWQAAGQPLVSAGGA